MTYDEALAYFGTQTKLAAALGVTQATVSRWGEGPRAHKTFTIPASYQYQIEVITNRQLLADAELRLPADRVIREPEPSRWDGEDRRRVG